MVLKILNAAFSAYFPTQYAVHITIGIVTVLALRAFSQGRKSNRDRDLHARKIIVTVCFLLSLVNCLSSHIDDHCQTGGVHANRANHLAIIGSARCTHHSPLTTSHRLIRSNHHYLAAACYIFQRADIRRTLRSFVTNINTFLLHTLLDWL